ncbi:hypothetical protein [Macrococcus sp. DPC7161]|uniref:hypothetical protein n=1 Tax=Macrococcus sp. DPC7161 TaxID=2507060 RepID=UPI00100B4E73|nr:hypothetical protein [Macrococcus sp. DPC7161]RXK19063.1 hypothetical protein ER639_01750 [Macrococcus sp. DPC7161]
MNTNEAINLIEMISNSYHQIAFTKEKSRIWIEILVKGDYELSKQKLEYHIINSKYAPVINDFLVIKKNNNFEKLEEIQSADYEVIRREENDPVLKEKRDAAKRRLIEKMTRMKEKIEGDAIE